MIDVYIGLGSNLDDPKQQVIRAVESLKILPDTVWVAQSSWYESEAIGPEQPNFINGVARIQTQLAPEILLDALQAIEQDHQRVRTQHWGPRTLDLDILLWGQEVLNSARLTVPHAFLKERCFVILPLLELAPSLMLPCGTALSSLTAQCGQQNIVKLNETT